MNLLWHSDAIWRQKTGSTLTQEMACHLWAASHYLNPSLLILCGVLRHSPEVNFIINAQGIYPWDVFENLQIWYVSCISPGPNELKIIAAWSNKTIPGAPFINMD